MIDNKVYYLLGEGAGGAYKLSSREKKGLLEGGGLFERGGGRGGLNRGFTAIVIIVKKN